MNFWLYNLFYTFSVYFYYKLIYILFIIFLKKQYSQGNPPKRRAKINFMWCAELTVYPTCLGIYIYFFILHKKKLGWGGNYEKDCIYIYIFTFTFTFIFIFNIFIIFNINYWFSLHNLYFIFFIIIYISLYYINKTLYKNDWISIFT